MAENSVPAREPKVWEKIPSRNPNFTGRKDLLQQLRQSINTVTAVVAQPQTLQGLGGVGKTQLAIEYAWQFRAHYDLVYWVSADTPMLVPSTLAGLAQWLGLPPASATGVELATQAVLRALQSGEPYRRWLVIFDNAEEPDNIKDFIPRGPGHVLITSRNPRWSDYESTLEVDVFEREESLAFVRKRLERDIPTGEADRLADKLGDLPLALEQAAALQRRTGMPVEEYLSLLDEQTSRLLNLEKPPNYPLPMTSAWRLSVSQLEDRIPEAVEVLRCCAFFGPEPIPRDVFRRGNEAVGPRLFRILSDAILLTRALSTLERFALVKVEPTTRTLQVHRVNQALLRDELPEETRAELQHEVHLLLARSAGKDPDDTTQWSRFEELAAHVRPSELIKCQEPSVREFALNIVRYLYVRGNYASAMSLVGECIESWSAASGERHQDVLVARIHLGNIYRALTMYTRAYESDSRSLEMMRETLGADHSETLWATSSYAATLRGRGEFMQAREVDAEARSAHERLYGEDDPRTLRGRNNLAIDYALTSEYEQAQRMHQEVYLIQSQAREGVGRRNLLNTWSNLSRAVRLSGQFHEATDLSEEAYGYGLQELGPDHPGTLQAAKDLAVSLRMSGRFAESLDRMRDTHMRLERLFGDVHAETMAAAVGLSNILRATGDLGEAMATLQRALPHYPEVFGADHPFTHACNLNLAILQRLRGEPGKALQTGEQALEGLTRRLGHDHDYTLTCTINLATDRAMLGDHEVACALGEEALRHIERRFTLDHYLGMVCAANLSQDLTEVGSKEQGERLYAETMGRFKEFLGAEHPATLGVLAGERLSCDFDPPPI